MSKKLRDICFYGKEKVETSNIDLNNYVSTENMLPNKSGIVPSEKLPNLALTPAFFKGDILVSNIRPYFKKIWYASSNGGCSNDVLVFRAKENIDSLYLYYLLADDNFFTYAMASAKGTKMPRGDKSAIMEYVIPEHGILIQQKIAKILSSIDRKIYFNNKINNNLEQQAQAIFKSWFVDKENKNRKTCKAEEYFDISIGKTPPRKEPQWFTHQNSDTKWVSIADMGNCGVYICDTSEYLLPEAISKFNVCLVPKDTVILSFKLTVGRIAITNEMMTTNEAIAHFKTNNKTINEYLYLYLKNFNFKTMGSTSSIATAVNSKIIKAMPFIIPTNEELSIFHKITNPIFKQIKANQLESKNLTQLRDALLPKLMSGEIDVENIDISTDKLSFS